jgi:hypothetical protein
MSRKPRTGIFCLGSPSPNILPAISPPAFNVINAARGAIPNISASIDKNLLKKGYGRLLLTDERMQRVWSYLRRRKIAPAVAARFEEHEYYLIVELLGLKDNVADNDLALRGLLVERRPESRRAERPRRMDQGACPAPGEPMGSRRRRVPVGRG